LTVRCNTSRLTHGRGVQLIFTLTFACNRPVARYGGLLLPFAGVKNLAPALLRAGLARRPLTTPPWPPARWHRRQIRR